MTKKEVTNTNTQPTNQPANTNQSNELVDSEKLDLDKNPIKYATSEPGVYTTEPHDKYYLESTLRHGQHSDLVKKILRQRIERRAMDFPRWPSDCNGGTRIMWIESKFWYDRERFKPEFDDDWRKYRARYLHSLTLDPREPIHVPEYETSLLNPIRRFYMKPGDWIEDNIIRKFVKQPIWSKTVRWCISATFFAYLGSIALYYKFRYHIRNWENKSGVQLIHSHPMVFPGNKLYPYKDPHTEPAHYHLLQFDKRTAFKDLRSYEDRSVF